MWVKAFRSGTTRVEVWIREGTYASMRELDAALFDAVSRALDRNRRAASSLDAVEYRAMAGSEGRLAGRVALVTGGARGTGEATARMFAAEGAKVVIGDLLADLGEAVAKEIGDAARYVHLDVTSETDWERAVETSVGHFGGLDVLVNNAGILKIVAIEDTSVEDFERLVAVNQLGPFLGIRAVITPMKAAGRGSIVNISSIDGHMGMNGTIAYASTKFAVRGMTRVAALELGRYGIRVNAVCPEAGGLEMVKPYMPENLDPELADGFSHRRLATQKNRTSADRRDDIARMVLFLASDESASCTGADFHVDSGNSAGRIIKGMPGS
jgi:3alpha(or 20beta)-hydroxysteroid dehydrogenase